MKFVFLYDNGRLHPVAEKVRSEQYEVENNINRVTGSTSIVITDKPFSATIYNNFCIGGSKFSESLLNTSYHDAILVMNNLEKSTVPSNTYISCWFNGVDFVFPAVISVNENKFMEGEQEDKELQQRIKLLKAFLESTDFGKLRRESEKHLIQGEKVKFIIYWKENKPSYDMVATEGGILNSEH